ncbi:hypothetical protein F9817_15510 [Vibrio sp. CAIM 722]|uniref:Uncharacterized protein n=1 Tax=Vibrio eleionomae TaxID=2653505 RepID=A0A7X4RVS4_9VIBR|nr:hypothetical protein [Vibrio eleionomae]MZI94600.1 hypothetical protein [Vibrio eleionomae]
MSNRSLALEQTIQRLTNRLVQDPEQVLTDAHDCLLQAKTYNDNAATLQCLLLITQSSWRLKELKASLKYIRAALRLQQSLDNDDYLADIYHYHAVIYWEQAQYYTAQQYWIQSLEQSAWSDNPCIQIEALLGLGNVWRVTEEYKLAKATHELAVRAANSIRHTELEARARIFLSWDLYYLERYPEMLTVLQGADDLLQHNPDKILEAQVWDFRAVALLELGQVDAAEKAANQAHALADTYQSVWMKTLAMMSLAKIELLKGQTEQALKWLREAESHAQFSEVNSDEILARIYQKQSDIAEQMGDMQSAYLAFKHFRSHSLAYVRSQTAQLGSDKARLSKQQLEQKARKLINRIRGLHEYNPDKRYSNMVSETFWWEQLVQLKTELRQSNYSVIVVRHNDPRIIDVCTELTHTLSSSNDFLTRLSSERVGWLIADKGAEAEQLCRTLSQMLTIYPWHRKGLSCELPSVILQNILMFPFTLEQLEQESDNEENLDRGKPA